jgi:hypothetical protein
VTLVINNFRFCRQAPCAATDSGYVRSPDGSGPVPRTDNADAVVIVHPGDRIVWRYEDQQPPGCDFYSSGPLPCPGHTVAFENGTLKGHPIGFAKARAGRTSITFTVPKGLAGRTIHYFCNVYDLHWRVGLTGIFKVAG